VATSQGNSSFLDAWIYVFSRFTPEALVFQSILILALLALYAAYWLLKRRRVGADVPEVPAHLVRGYLLTLIHEAEDIRSQLFGLLTHEDHDARRTSRNSPSLLKGAGPSLLTPEFPTPPGAGAVHAPPSGVQNDPELAQKLRDLERKLQDQHQAYEGVISERERLLKELQELRAQKSTPSASNGSGDAGLKDRLAELEARLAEYAIIEDDLANLKRLQQENLQLKAQLGTAPASSAVSTPAPVAAQPAAEVQTPVLAVAETKNSEEKPEQKFESLVQEVEQSLPKDSPTLPPLETTKDKSQNDKSDADLIAEFEKMLNS
jgi:hypothetical protein